MTMPPTLDPWSPGLAVQSWYVQGAYSALVAKFETS